MSYLLLFRPFCINAFFVRNKMTYERTNERIHLRCLSIFGIQIQVKIKSFSAVNLVANEHGLMVRLMLQTHFVKLDRPEAVIFL